jgi:hypothetical protein
LFEVTQPRVTCYRVGIRMEEPQMAALLVAHGRPGFYLRVLEEGEVEAGDEILRVASGPERMSVFEINALLYMPGHPRSQLERALRIPALSAGWRGSLESGLPLAGGIVGAGGELEWPNPTRPGDSLLVESEVLDVRPSRSRPDRGIITVRSLTRNHRNDVVQRLTAKLIVPRRI